MTISRRNLLRALFSTEARKGLTISRDAALEPGGFVTELMSLGRPGAPYSDTADLQDAQIRNELVFACLAIKASTAQDPRLIVQQQRTARGKTTYEEVPNHPLRQLLAMSEADLMKAALISWDVSNPRRAYFEKVYTGALLTGLNPLNPVCMHAERSRSSGELLGYTYRDGTHRREYGLDELIVRAAPAWYDPPPLVAALGSVASDTAQTDYIRAFFDNGGVPAGFLKYNMPMNDTQRGEVRAKWSAIYGNRYRRQHDVGVLDANVDYQEIGAPLDKLSSQTLRSVAESRICMVFGVPPLIVYAYVGLLRATYSNLKEAWAGFWDATMSPAFKEWRIFWTRALLPEFESERDIRSERVRLHYDLSAVAALQEDVDATQKRARENWTAGGISQNEFRAAIGYEPRPGGDEVFAKPSPTPTTTTTTPAGAGKERKERDGATVAMIERRMEREVRSYLLGEYQAAVAAVRSE